jgi:hypothetical protein
MNHAPEYIAIMKILAPLIRDVPKFSVWQFGTLCDWMAYFWNRGTLSFVIEEGEPLGFCTIKLFRELGQFLEPFVHDPCGRYAMVEALVARTPQAWARMFEELVGRWGRVEVVLWDRGMRTENGAPRMYRWNDYIKLVRRSVYGQCAKSTSTNYTR